MRLLRYGDIGHEKPGLLDKTGQIRDLSGLVEDINGFILDKTSLDRLKTLDPERLPLVGNKPRLGACVTDVSKVIGVAINYLAHGTETGSRTPTEPTLFLKAPSSICGPDDNILLPPGSEKTDWEVELGVVIGQRAKNISEQQALDHVAGYCVIDDVSERAFQLERGGQQHTKGKSCDSFCPLGPWLVTPDEIHNPQALNLWTKVNGVVMQQDTTASMLFSVAKLISYISEFMTLLPGDVIATGTPEGVGRGRTPPLYLRSGDSLELGIEGLGIQHHIVQ